MAGIAWRAPMADWQESSARLTTELIKHQAIQPASGLASIFFSLSFIEAGKDLPSDDALYWLCRVGAWSSASVGLVAIAHDVWWRIRERTRASLAKPS
jgi:hypothetical protein